MLKRVRLAFELAVVMVMPACSSPLPIPPYFEAFERLPIHTVQVKGETMAYLDSGQGKAVILIHGFGGSMWQWEHQQTSPLVEIPAHYPGPGRVGPLCKT